MSRRAVIKRGKVRRGRFLGTPSAWLLPYGLAMRRSAPVRFSKIVMFSLADLTPTAEEQAAAEAFFADVDKWGGPMPDEVRAHLVWEGRIFGEEP